MDGWKVYWKKKEKTTKKKEVKALTKLAYTEKYIDDEENRVICIVSAITDTGIEVDVNGYKGFIRKADLSIFLPHGAFRLDGVSDF